ncbi:hypothetical protein PF008_g20203 [Phytophthora fragariae]|uniref:Uncharacterized protein n=1 Tax=Phytophthora fragariae TaxID=53985 RepID=A0A6G0R065_9STRA|nr:hypothetical protein PF008_g20203 [Phytophthora fragariae]
MDDEDTLALVQTVQEEEIATLILFELVLSAPLSYRDRLLVPDFRLDILAMPDQEAKDQFRFIICDLQKLVQHLKIPDPVITKEGVRATALEALAIFFGRMVYPHRWIDMAVMFGRAPSTQCHIFYFVVEHLDKTFADLLYFDADRITKNLDRYCRELQQKRPTTLRAFGDLLMGP